MLGKYILANGQRRVAIIDLDDPDDEAGAATVFVMVRPGDGLGAAPLVLANVVNGGSILRARPETWTL